MCDVFWLANDRFEPIRLHAITHDETWLSATAVLRLLPGTPRKKPGGNRGQGRAKGAPKSQNKKHRFPVKIMIHHMWSVCWSGGPAKRVAARLASQHHASTSTFHKDYKMRLKLHAKEVCILTPPATNHIPRGHSFGEKRKNTNANSANVEKIKTTNVNDLTCGLALRLKRETIIPTVNSSI